MMITCPVCYGKGEIEEISPTFLPATQLRIYNMVRRSPHGLTASAIAERIYCNRGDDAPNHPVQTIWGLVQAANRRLAAVDQKIISTGGPGSLYKLLTPTLGSVQRDANR
jgi:hypothetical protein